MSNLTKIQREIKSMVDKTSYGLNLMITNRIKSLGLIDCLIDLKVIIKQIEKTNNNERLQMKETEGMIRKVLKELEKGDEFK